MVFKVKSFDEKVKEYRMTFGKNKDELLENVDPDYLDWTLKNYDRLTDWDRKIINRYLLLRAIEFKDQQEVDLEEHQSEMLNWVDENF